MTDVRTYCVAVGDPDHYLVKALYRCRIMTWKNEHLVKEPKTNIQKLEIPEIREAYQRILQGKANEEPKNNVKAWANVKQRVTEAAITVLGYENRLERNDWFDEECTTTLTLKNQAYKAWLSRPTWIMRTECEKQRRRADKLYRKKKRPHLNKSLCRTSERFKENGLHMAFNEVKSLKEGLKPSTQLIIESQGNIIGDRIGIRRRWKEYFKVSPNGTSNEKEEMDKRMELEEALDIVELHTLEEV
jgi:hypothetical protein